MFSEKNQRSYWSWQGNHLGFSIWYSIIGVIIIFILLFLIFIFKDRIKSKWKNKDSYFFIFRKEKYLWKTIGSIIIILQIVRALTLSTYIRQWEIWIPIHLCRLHIIVIGILLIIGKEKWIKYLASVSFIGALIGVGLANLHIDPKDLDLSNNEEAKNLSIKMLIEGKYSFYSLGPDTFVFQEFFFSHILIATLPAFLWVANKQKMSIKHFWYSQIGYFATMIAFWSFNWASSSIKNTAWNANAWYIGPDDQNDFKNVLGWLSQWPQNLFTFSLLIGTPSMWLVYFAIHLFGNMIWDKKKRKIIFKRTESWIEVKSDLNNILLKIKKLFKKSSS